MIGRREIIRLFAGAGAAAGSGLSVGDVIGMAAKHPNTLNFRPSMPEVIGHQNHWRDETWALAQRIRRRREADADVMRGGIPHDIASKRSWSPAFKAHVLQQEYAAIDALASGTTFAEEVARMLGLEV